MILCLYSLQVKRRQRVLQGRAPRRFLRCELLPGLVRRGLDVEGFGVFDTEYANQTKKDNISARHQEGWNYLLVPLLCLRDLEFRVGVLAKCVRPLLNHARRIYPGQALVKAILNSGQLASGKDTRNTGRLVNERV